RYAEGSLRAKTVTSHATVLFTQNVPYLQGGFKPELRFAKAGEFFRAYTLYSAQSHDRCCYCGRQSVRVDSGSGYACREEIPLLSGRSTINFLPSGGLGIPLCGYCVVALQAL